MGAAASTLKSSAWEVGNAHDYHDNLFDRRANKTNFAPQQQQQQQTAAFGNVSSQANNRSKPANAIPPGAFFAGEPSLSDWLTQHGDFVEDAIRASEKEGDEISLKFNHVLQLLRGSAGWTDLPSQPHVVKSVRMVGQAEPDSVRLTSVEFEIELLKEGWVAVRLMPGFVAMLSSAVSFVPSHDDNSDVDARAGATHVVGVVEKWYCLIASKPGVYKVNASVLLPFLSARKTGFAAVIPHASSATLEFSVPDSGVLIKCEPALETITERVEPLPDSDDDDSSGTDSALVPASGRTTVRCRLPPTSQFTVQWTEYLGTEQDKEDEGGLKADVSSTVEQHCLASVGEGMLSCTNTFAYTITSGQISLFRVLIDPEVKVLGVEGMKNIPIKRWEVKPYGKADDDKTKAETVEEKLLLLDDDDEHVKGSKKGKKAGKTSKKSKSSKNSDNNSDSRPKQLLTVLLDYGLEDTYTFTVTSEVEMAGTTAKVVVPVLTTLIHSETPDVVREKGFVAVVARTNVEIDESVCDGSLSPIDVAELPKKLASSSVHTILHAYKFLQPQWELQLDVKKHADANVLVAAADSAHFRATVAMEGHVIYQLLLRVRNTQKQYLRVTIPPEAGGREQSVRKRGAKAEASDDDDNIIASSSKKNNMSFEIWSTVVGGRAVKPALDDATGDILVPLQKSDGSGGQRGAFSVEMSFLVEGGKKLENRDFLGLAFATVDLPINQFYATIHLPDDCQYGEFEGDLKEVSYHDGSPPSADSARAPAPPQRQWGARGRRDSISSELMLSKKDTSMNKNKRQEMSYNGKQLRKKEAGKRGVVPVRIEVAEEGRPFYFQRLLVSNQNLQLRVEYRVKDKKKKKSK